MSEAAKRKIRNFVLQPLLQVRLGLQVILLSLLFGVAVTATVYYSVQDFYGLVLDLTDLRDELTPELSRYAVLAVWRVALVAVVYVLAVLVVSVVSTHRLVGPTYAFRRHIQGLLEGRSGVRTTLREADAFQEVADDLNRLSAHLEAQRKNGPGA